MSVVTKNSLRIVKAKEIIRFYGFWLWTYMVGPNDKNYDPRKIFEENRARIQEICTKCNRNDFSDKKCDHCEYFICEQNHEVVSSIFHPIAVGFSWSSDSVMRAFIHEIGTRCSSKEILLDAYRKGSGNQESEFEKIDILGFWPNLMPPSITKIDVKAQNSPIGNARCMQRLTINPEIPTVIRENDNSRSKAYLKWLDVIGLPHHEENYYAFMMSDGMVNSEYCIAIKNCIKNMPLVSFSPSDYASRAIGFWLWEQIDELKSFNSDVEAVSYLQSGIEYPQDLLSKLNFNPRSMRRFNRLHQRTIACIDKGEVLSLK